MDEAKSSLPPALQAYVTARRVLALVLAGLGARVDEGPVPIKSKKRRLLAGVAEDPLASDRDEREERVGGKKKRSASTGRWRLRSLIS